MTSSSMPPFLATPNSWKQHNYEDLEPTDTPNTIRTDFQASSDQPFSPMCDHNPMASQCNQSQYPNPNHIFALP